MKVEILPLSQVKKEYSDFVENFSSATPFHTVEWLTALENSLGNKCEVAMFYEGADLIGVCPLFKKNVSLMKIYFSPIFGTETAYLGVLGKDLSGMLNALKQKVGDFFVIQPPNLKVSVRGFLVENKDTIITPLDSASAEEHFKRVRKGHRYDTKKAEKDGVTISEDYSKGAISEYCKMLAQTYGKSDYAPLPESLYQDVISSLHEKNQIKFLFAEYEGKRIAGGVFPYFNDTVYYWTGGSRKEKEYTSLYPNNLIQWELIKWGYEQGLKNYDMLGGSHEGIRQFKLGWGGNLQSYQRIYSSQKLKLMANLYSKLGSGIKEKIRKGVRS